MCMLVYGGGVHESARVQAGSGGVHGCARVRAGSGGVYGCACVKGEQRWRVFACACMEVECMSVLVYGRAAVACMSVL